MNWLVVSILEVAKLTIAGVAVFFVAYFVVKRYVERSQNLHAVNLKRPASKIILPLRLQAYERITLFIERLNPANLFVRNHTQGATVQELQQFLIQEIREEFQHNLSQQIYLSPMSWSVAKKVKDETLLLINNAAKGLPSGAPAIELGRVILTHLSSLEVNPYEAALVVIREDVEKLF